MLRLELRNRLSAGARMIQVRNRDLPSAICGRCGLKVFPVAAMEAHMERHRVLDGGAERKRRGRPRGRTVGAPTTKRMGAIVKTAAPEIRIGKSGKNG